MQPLNVLITVDTEPSLSPAIADNPRALAKLYERDIIGSTGEGEFGLAYQCHVLKQYGLRAVFLVEPLFAMAMGEHRLREVVDTIQASNHDVQLHIHTEWLKLRPLSCLAGRTGDDISAFTYEEQVLLLSHARQMLIATGGRDICAFRAGNYGADRNTLRALKTLGIPYDTSYNASYLGTRCRIQTERPLVQPQRLEDIVEFPISVFEDYPGHCRHAQLCATSWPEMRKALDHAHEHEWRWFVIVSHSFELLKRRRHSVTDRYNAEPDHIVIKRFESLCQFLASNPDRFVSRVFEDLDPAGIVDNQGVGLPKTGLYNAGRRMIEQFARRL